MLLPAALFAQYSTPVGPAPGSRVRVANAGEPEPVLGRVIAFGGDSLLLGSTSGRARARLPLGDLTRIDVSDGRDRWASAYRAGVLGALLGTAYGVLTLGKEDPTGGLVSALAGAIVIAPIGAGVGAILAPERWHGAWRGDETPMPGGAYRLEIEPGTDVRLVTHEARQTGRASGVDGDTIALSHDGRIQRYALREARRIEIRGGDDTRKGVLVGAGLAVIVTGVAGGIDVSKGNISAGEVVGAAALNALLGGVIGYALAPGGWERLPLPRR